MSELIDPRFKTAPRAHQLAIFEATKDAEYHALFHEQRTGKTKIVLDTAAHQHRAGRIEALLVIAPNGVHVNWAREEIPRHLPDDVRARVVTWRSGRMRSRTAAAELEALLTHAGLAILCVNVDALRTPGLRDYLTRLFRARRNRVMAVIDEALDIGGRDSQRTEIALKIGRRAATRRILEGTPAAASPLGLWGPTEFLRHGALGFSSFYGFRARYAELADLDVGPKTRACPACAGADPACPRCRGRGTVGEKSVRVVRGYRNLDELKERLAAFSSRVRRADCADLPPKIYQKAFFELTPTQRAAYDQLREEAVVTLASGRELAAPLILTRLLRLQQIASNLAPSAAAATPCSSCVGAGCAACEAGWVLPTGNHALTEPVDPDRNPRLEVLFATIERLDGPGIVWARFTADVDSIVAGARERGWRTVRYDGAVSPAEKIDALGVFQGGAARLLVGSARAGGRGLDLARASWVATYSHDWSLRYRLQSEDRAISLTKTDPVLYVDVVAEETVDEKILATLRSGRGVAEAVQGDPTEAWL